MDGIPLRLPPGADLRRALEGEAVAHGSSAFVVAGIGSLIGGRIRFAGEVQETELQGPFELLSLSGTLSPDGSHLHMAVADAQGRVLGGHVCYGNTIRTTAEVLLARLSGWQLGRAQDAMTGYRELVVRQDGVEPPPNPVDGSPDTPGR